MIKIKFFYTVRTWFNPLCCDCLKSGFKFGSEKSIKRQFNHNISWLVDLDRLDHLSLNLTRRWTLCDCKNAKFEKHLRQKCSRGNFFYNLLLLLIFGYNSNVITFKLTQQQKNVKAYKWIWKKLLLCGYCFVLGVFPRCVFCFIVVFLSKMFYLFFLSFYPLTLSLYGGGLLRITVSSSSWLIHTIIAP